MYVIRCFSAALAVVVGAVAVSIPASASDSPQATKIRLPHDLCRYESLPTALERWILQSKNLKQYVRYMDRKCPEQVGDIIEGARQLVDSSNDRQTTRNAIFLGITESDRQPAQGAGDAEGNSVGRQASNASTDRGIPESGGSGSSGSDRGNNSGGESSSAGGGFDGGGSSGGGNNSSGSSSEGDSSNIGSDAGKTDRGGRSRGGDGNNGHGNNIDGNDTGNPGKSNDPEDDDDDERGSGRRK